MSKFVKPKKGNYNGYYRDDAYFAFTVAMEVPS